MLVGHKEVRRMGTVISVVGSEYKKLLRSTKIIILGLFIIFMNIQIIAPLKTCSAMMQEKLSIWEPFIAVGNSGVVVLVLPMFFLAMMADFPREDGISLFYQIRCTKKAWIVGQIGFAMLSSVTLVLFAIVASVLLILPCAEWKTEFSRAITYYVSVYPEHAGDYVVQLVPQNLYNQMTLMDAVGNTVLLLILYFFLLALVILLFSLLNKKIIGILLDGFIISAGAILCAAKVSYMWILPMSHTITWLHYTEYIREEVFPMYGSYLYFVLMEVVLIALCLVAGKRYQVYGS